MNKAIDMIKKFILYSFLAAACFAAEPVKIPALGDYKEVEFIKVEADVVRFFHRDGVGKIALKDLPPDILLKIESVPKVDMVAKKAEELKAEKEKVFEEFRVEFGGKITGKLRQVVGGGSVI